MTETSRFKDAQIKMDFERRQNDLRIAMGLEADLTTSRQKFTDERENIRAQIEVLRSKELELDLALSENHNELVSTREFIVSLVKANYGDPTKTE